MPPRHPPAAPQNHTPSRQASQKGKPPGEPDLSETELQSQFEALQSGVTTLIVTLGSDLELEALVRRLRGQAATLGRDLQRIANAGQPNAKRIDPSVPGMLSQEDFVQDVRKLTWKVMEVLTDTANMAPRARLKFLRRQLRNRGLRFELLARAQVVDRAALLAIIERACPPQVAAPSAPTSKTIPIEKLADRQVSDLGRVSRRRLILNIGRDRVVFDFVSRLTVLEPATGDAPAKVVPFKPRSRRKSN